MFLHFTKMHALGNDFMVINSIHNEVEIKSKSIKKWSNRYTGVGFDQLLLIKQSTTKADFSYTIFNADGSEAENCGNGVRCIAYFLVKKKLTTKRLITLETKNSLTKLQVYSSKEIRAEMGSPHFGLKKRVVSPHSSFIGYQENDGIEVILLSIGNPHGVIRVNSISNYLVDEIGSQLQSMPWVLNGINVGFLEVINSEEGKLRVYERGCGETRACGTGACAAAVIAINQGWMVSPVILALPGGKIKIEWEGEKKSIFMTGSASYVYDAHLTWS